METDHFLSPYSIGWLNYVFLFIGTLIALTYRKKVNKPIFTL